MSVAPSSRLFLGTALAALAAGALPSSARADTGDIVAAEALFRDGKDLLAHQDYGRACPKLGESFRLDPASGTLLALAICHEREGKLASAWGEYSDVASRSRLEARRDREIAARAKAAELEPRVSMLTVIVPEAAVIAGFEVRRNGVLVPPAWFGTPVPVDGGIESIDASAPGRRPRHVEISVAPSGARPRVTILPLEGGGAVPTESKPEPRADAPTPAIPSAPAPAESAPPVPGATPAAPATTAPAPATAPIAAAPVTTAPPEGAPGFSLAPLQVGGVIAAAAGVASAGVGIFFTIQALSKNNASHDQCEVDLCTPAGKQDRNDALSSGNIATAALIGGGVLAAAGATLYWLGQRTRTEGATAKRSLWVAYPTAGDHGVGAVLQGDF